MTDWKATIETLDDNQLHQVEDILFNLYAYASAVHLRRIYRERGNEESALEMEESAQKHANLIPEEAWLPSTPLRLFVDPC